jgi:2,3-bisphosphoglycerate-independent phosphoglycerate mutase
MADMKKKVALIVLDGWGYGLKDSSDAIHNANTPCVDELHASVPHASLRTDGNFVGLPLGQMGNSEVGHMNIGAGRIVFQDLLRINTAIEKGTFSKEKVLHDAFQHAKSNNVRLHLMGLVSNGGVHSQQEHLHELVSAVSANGVQDVVIHAFTDGRDTPPKKAAEFISDLEHHLLGTEVKIATVHGRYYAMDRDNRMERIAKSCKLLFSTNPTGVQSFKSAVDGIEASYANGITDEFIEPFSIDTVDGVINPGDAVICFNFRTDRCRQITSALALTSYPEHGLSPLPLYFVTMTNYDDRFKGIKVVYDKPNLEETLGQVISDAGLTQLRMAETEKYPHVTFFFNGGREKPFEGEYRLMAHSPKVATYDLQPEMSANKLVELVIPEMESERPDFICLNFANPDMVGHTGVYDAIIKAVETTDTCLEQILKVGKANGYQFVIIADHGNADKAVNPDGTPHTAHTTNPVPIMVVTDKSIKLEDGILADIAPTILDLMGVTQPMKMTGKSLIS